MRKRLLKVSFMLLVVLLTLGIWGCSSSKETDSKETKVEEPAKETVMKPVELRFANFFPPVHAIETELVTQWAQAVEEATDGLVKVKSFPGGTLLDAPGTYEGVRSGVADVGLSVFGYSAGRFPLIEVFELPGIVYKNSAVASRVTWEAIKGIQPKEIQDTQLMFAFATGPGHFYTKTPVQNLNDLKGMEIRGFGLTVKTLEALGAVPVGMPQSEVYDAISKGVVKGNMAPLEVLKGYRQAEVTKYLTYTPFLYNATFFVTMNKDVWASFPKEIQDKILAVNEKIFNEVAVGVFEKINEEGLKFGIEKGMQVLPELSKEETAKWIAKVEPIQEDWLNRMEKSGLDGRKMIDMVKQLAEKYNAQY